MSVTCVFVNLEGNFEMKTVEPKKKTSKTAIALAALLALAFAGSILFGFLYWLSFGFSGL